MYECLVLRFCLAQLNNLNASNTLPRLGIIYEKATPPLLTDTHGSCRDVSRPHVRRVSLLRNVRATNRAGPSRPLLPPALWRSSSLASTFG